MSDGWKSGQWRCSNTATNKPSGACVGLHNVRSLWPLVAIPN